MPDIDLQPLAVGAWLGGFVMALVMHERTDKAQEERDAAVSYVRKVEAELTHLKQVRDAQTTYIDGLTQESGKQ